MIVDKLDIEGLAKEYVRCLEFLRPAIAMYDTHNESDIFDLIVNSNAYLVALEQSAGILEVIEYPKYDALRIWLAGGQLEELTKFYTEIEEFAKMLGCKKVEIFGRKGWEKIHPNFENKGIILTKEIK